MLGDETGGKLDNPGDDGSKSVKYRPAVDDTDAPHGEVSAAFETSNAARLRR